MRFQRSPRMSGYTWTKRKESAYLQRHKRVAQRLERDVPLFADQFAPQPKTDVDAEKARREHRAMDSQQTMRDLDAKHWRAGRAAYFACTPEIRAQIMLEWNVWRGPLRATYFIYVVEKHSGEAERRRLHYEAQHRALVARIWNDLNAQGSLAL